MLRTAEQIKQMLERDKAILIHVANKSILDDPGYETVITQFKDGELELIDHILKWMEVQEGDKLTGLEILVGMPREERKKFLTDRNTCPNEIGLYDINSCDDDLCEACRLFALNIIYERKSGTWVPVGEK